MVATITRPVLPAAVDATGCVLDGDLYCGECGEWVSDVDGATADYIQARIEAHHDQHRDTDRYDAYLTYWGV